jgi:hypothetical protein
MKTCPNCGQRVDQDAAFCSQGHLFPAETPPAPPEADAPRPVRRRNPRFRLAQLRENYWLVWGFAFGVFWLVPKLYHAYNGLQEDYGLILLFSGVALLAVGFVTGHWFITGVVAVLQFPTAWTLEIVYTYYASEAAGEPTLGALALAAWALPAALLAIGLIKQLRRT